MGMGDGGVFHTTVLKHALVGCILRFSESGVGVCKYYCALARDCLDNDSVLQNIAPCDVSPRPIHFLGIICNIFKLFPFCSKLVFSFVTLITSSDK